MVNKDEVKKFLGIPCGCDSRKDIMGAGDWKTDAILVGAIVLLITGVLVAKNTNILSKVANGD